MEFRIVQSLARQSCEGFSIENSGIRFRGIPDDQSEKKIKMLHQYGINGNFEQKNPMWAFLKNK